MLIKWVHSLSKSLMLCSATCTVSVRGGVQVQQAFRHSTLFKTFLCFAHGSIMVLPHQPANFSLIDYLDLQADSAVLRSCYGRQKVFFLLRHEAASATTAHRWFSFVMNPQWTITYLRAAVLSEEPTHVRLIASYLQLDQPPSTDSGSASSVREPQMDVISGLQTHSCNSNF